MSDVVELVNLVELDDMYVYEERGRRIARDSNEFDDTDSEAAPSGESKPRIRNLMGVTELSGPDHYGIAFRFRIVFDDRAGNEFIADVQARYGLPHNCQISDDIKSEFAQEVAFYAVYPYLRASLQMTASRMGVPAPVLAIVRRGEFELGEQMSDDQTRLEFHDNAPDA
ncbi:hypothetical protein FGG90_10475 [Clavibacter tessellarius]|uniref:hypothetical protein n=1 Tax=Clavibacter tessellarius TaxID=31965 RepID=UPI0010563656|nr:hypothetical protein [Clavibacter michiganensis]UKF34382.1 hypothetical protein FGG90_10475 [Clavibacter michiganensis subsp. tessellarius]